MQGRQVDRNGAQSRHYVLPPNKTRCSCSFALRIDMRGKNTCTLSGDINITLTYQSDSKAWLSSSLDHLNIDKKYRLKRFCFITSKRITVCRKCLVAILVYMVFLIDRFLSWMPSLMLKLFVCPLRKCWFSLLYPDVGWLSNQIYLCQFSQPNFQLSAERERCCFPFFVSRCASSARSSLNLTSFSFVVAFVIDWNFRSK